MNEISILCCDEGNLSGIQSQKAMQSCTLPRFPKLRQINRKQFRNTKIESQVEEVTSDERGSPAPSERGPASRSTGFVAAASTSGAD